MFIVIPVRNAFGDLGQMRTGGWLGFFGGVLLAAGTVMLSRAALGLSASRATTTTAPGVNPCGYDVGFEAK